MQQPSNLPQQIRVPTLGGINERVTQSGLKPGEFSYLEGLFPDQVGQLARVPGKVLKITLPGGVPVLQITQTFNRNGDLLFQTSTGRFAATLDEVQGRQTTPNLTPGTTPGTPTSEESMSIAIMYQEEANTVNGGSIAGWLSGTDNTSTNNTFYPRRLTTCPTNQSATLSFFTASTGGSLAASTGGQFVLPAGTYRIKAALTFGVPANPAGYIFGLWSVTGSVFQLDDNSGPAGGGSPIIGMVPYSNMATNGNFIGYLEGRFVVSGSPVTFEIMQAVAGVSNEGRNKTTCGTPSGLTGSGAQVNGAAAKERYAVVEILKEP